MNTTTQASTTRVATTTREAEIRQMLDRYDLRFSTDDGWAVLVRHVERHAEILKATLKIDAKWHEAVFAWEEEVFKPLFQVISPWSYHRAFGGQHLGDLYLAVSDHWGYLKERTPRVSANVAARSFLAHYGKGAARYFSRFLA